MDSIIVEKYKQKYMYISDIYIKNGIMNHNIVKNVLETMSPEIKNNKNYNIYFNECFRNSLINYDKEQQQNTKNKN